MNDGLIYYTAFGLNCRNIITHVNVGHVFSLFMLGVLPLPAYNNLMSKSYVATRLTSVLCYFINVIPGLLAFLNFTVTFINIYLCFF